MADTAADVLIETIHRWGVDVVFGLPGDGINGLMESLRLRQDKIRFIQVRHEEAAAFAACGYARWTGRLGCCLATSGPGGVHLLNGLYDAKLDRVPVLAITGMHYHDLLDTYAQQDVALDRLFMDAAVYSTRIMGPAHVENAANLACRMALSRRGVAHIAMPADFQSRPVDAAKPSKRNVAHHVSYAGGARCVVPTAAELDRAAAILNAGRKVAVLCGQGAAGASSALAAVADRLAAPVAKALLGKDVFPDDHPLCTGGVGHLGTRPSQQAMQQCDTLLIVGSGFPYIEYYPAPGAARAVQIDIDLARIGLRYPAEAGLVGDARETLAALLPRLQPRADRSFLDGIQRARDEWDRGQIERATGDERPMRPQRVAHELAQRLRDDAIVTTDSGTDTFWAARYIPMRGERRFGVSGTLASMGCGLPYAIAAALAYPGRQVVAFVGDGGLTMLMGELATCAKYKLPVKVVVVKNNSLAMIKWEQMSFQGNPEFGCELQPIDFAKVAEACGARGFTVDDPARCGDVIAAALAHDGPALVEAVTDPDEPITPPVPQPEEARNIEKALARGTPNAERIRRIYRERAEARLKEPV